MEFCPTCGNILQYQMAQDINKRAGFFCRSCPYVCRLDSAVKITRGVKLSKKEVITKAVEQKNDGPRTAMTCPKCGHEEATFDQRQTRGGDEGSTIFYTCLNVKCKNNFKDE